MEEIEGEVEKGIEESKSNVQVTKALKVDLKKIFNNNELLAEVVAVMQKTFPMDSESIARRVMPDLIQGENNK